MFRQKKHDNNRITYIALAVLSVIMIVMIVISLIYYGGKIAAVHQMGDQQVRTGNYIRHYVMIVDDRNLEFWQSVYEGARDNAEQNGILLEFMGDEFSTDYSVPELMKMAIAAKVDGILLESDGSKELGQLINQASDMGIPVVTLLKDIPDTERISHVGISYYSLGQQYAEQLATLISGRTLASGATEYSVLVLMNDDINDSSRNIVYSTIKDTLDSRADLRAAITINSRMIESTTAFSAEESIRSLFVREEELPDAIVCLDEVSSACVYQALVDYNQVGRIEMIGYYTGATVISGIAKKIIYSTTGVDTYSLGKSGIDALQEYLETGYTSDYYSVDTFVVNQFSIDEFTDDEGRDSK